MFPYLAPAVFCVVIVATPGPLQAGAQTRHKIPDGPRDLKKIFTFVSVKKLNIKIYHNIVVEGEKEADNDHGQTQAPEQGGDVTEHLDRPHSCVLAQGDLRVGGLNSCNLGSGVISDGIAHFTAELPRVKTLAVQQGITLGSRE